jgi:hypothetical protein
VLAEKVSRKGDTKVTTMNDITFDDNHTTSIPKPAPKQASEKSLRYMRSLADERDTTAMLEAMPENWRHYYHKALVSSQVAQQDASKFITELLKQPKKTQQQPKPEQQKLTDGIYRQGDRIYKVYWNLEHTRLLTKELVPDCYDANSGKTHYQWVYRGQASKFVRPADKLQLTLAQASEFGALYGRCSQCGRELNNELSIHLGIGPVCGQRDFGGEFKVMIDQAKLELGL